MNFRAIKRLARKVDQQNLYARAKELGCVHIFNNVSDFSYIQTTFLSWLETYNTMYVDLALDKPNIDEDVMKDELRTEAYLFWRSKNKDAKKEQVSTSKVAENSPPKILFSKKR